MSARRTVANLALGLLGFVLLAPEIPAQNATPAPSTTTTATTEGNTATPRVDRRERAQKKRIRQGVRTGEVTGREAARLKAEQAKIRADEKAAKADGTVTAEERARLAREQNRASRDINRQKNDRQDRPRRP